MNCIEHKLAELGLALPIASCAAGHYDTYLLFDKRILLSGQTCRLNGAMRYTGRLGAELDIEQGRQAARICILNLLAQLKEACDGDLGRVAGCVRISVFVNSVAGFSDQSRIADGASDLLAELLGKRGRHVRSAVGVSSLPGNAAVEIDAEFSLY